MKQAIFILIILFSKNIQICKAENKNIDSLIQIATSQKQDSSNIIALNKLSMYFEYNDTLKAWMYNRQAIALGNTLQWISGLAKTYMITGWLYQDISKYDLALDFMNKSLSLYQIISTKKPEDLSNIAIISGCYNNLGNIYANKGNYPKALQNYILGLKKVENLLQNYPNNQDYLRKVTACYTNLGSVYAYMNDNRNALVYFIKAKDMAVILNDSNIVARCFMNMGIIYKTDSMYNKSIESYQIAKRIFENQKDNEGKGLCLQNLGNVLMLNHNYEKALDVEKQALEINMTMGNKQNVCMIMGIIGNILKNQNKLAEAEKYLKDALKIAEEIKSINNRMTITLSLSEIFAHKKEFEHAYNYHKIYSISKDSIFNNENSKQFAEMKEKYESDKKQLEIEKLGKQKELDKQTIIAQNAENKKQKILIISFIAGFILILIFSILLYRLFLQKKKANILLAQQYSEILLQKEEISTQRDEITAQRDEIEANRDEIEAQRDLVTIQKEHIEIIHKAVTDSINYAKRIQEAVLPVSAPARAVLGEHFILFKPKDIVSGDFYWTTQITTMGHAPLLIVAVADCTGHGVPGAFMSMLGISFLNEIVRKQEVTQANQVLNELRKEVINALQQRGKTGEQKDGMDISLLVVNTETNECQWAGANNPLYIIHTSDLTTFQKLSNLEEVKGDKMPIAIHPVMSDFTNHEFKVEKGDCLYLFSDGFADQFGGPKGKKFMYKQFKEILVQTCPGMSQQIKTMNEQKEILEKVINEWIGNGEQVDDITIVGIKI